MMHRRFRRYAEPTREQANAVASSEPKGWQRRVSAGVGSAVQRAQIFASPAGLDHLSPRAEPLPLGMHDQPTLAIGHPGDVDSTTIDVVEAPTVVR
jgi:hypothetical protein